MWKCTGCQEEIEDSFSVCWNCGTSYDGVPDPNFQTVKNKPERYPPREQSSTLKCLRCGSNKVIPSVTVVDREDHGSGELNVKIERNPDALIFKQPEYAALRARICSNCGHTELFVVYPERLWEAYQTKLEND